MLSVSTNSNSCDTISSQPLAPSLCFAQCCVLQHDPYQPTGEEVLRATRKKRKVGKNEECRSFQKKWYEEFPWLTLCTTRNSVFCFYCRQCEARGELVLSKNLELAFTRDGFNNWKKAREKFETHQVSEGHKEAMFKMKRCSMPSIHSQLQEAAQKIQAKRRDMFLKELSCLRVLLRQGLAIRGHDEKEGNLRQLLHLYASGDANFIDWINNGTYLSVDIVNECVLLMGHHLLRALLRNIQEVGVFSVLADETRDVSNHEQLAICIRWVDTEFVIHEDLIGLMHVEKTDANTLTTAIKDVLIRCSLPLSQCRGQGYDGASTMMGHLTGVATQLKKEEPSAIEVHCLAHCLNLCLQDAAKMSTIVRDCLGLIGEISQLIHYSPKRSLVFNKCKNELNPNSHGLKPLCPTRWTVRTGAIESVIENYQALIQAFEEINGSSHDDYGRRAGGVLAQLQKFQTYFGLELCYLVFAVTEEVSLLLQGKSTTLQDALQQADTAKSYLQRQRSDEAFRVF